MKNKNEQPPEFFKNTIPKISLIIGILAGLYKLNPQLLNWIAIIVLGISLFFLLGFVYPNADKLMAHILKKSPNLVKAFVGQWVRLVDSVFNSTGQFVKNLWTIVMAHQQQQPRSLMWTQLRIQMKC